MDINGSHPPFKQHKDTHKHLFVFTQHPTFLPLLWSVNIFLQFFTFLWPFPGSQIRQWHTNHFTWFCPGVLTSSTSTADLRTTSHWATARTLFLVLAAPQDFLEGWCSCQCGRERDVFTQTQTQGFPSFLEWGTPVENDIFQVPPHNRKTKLGQLNQTGYKCCHIFVILQIPL